VASEKVVNGGKAREPAAPAKAIAAGLCTGTNPCGFVGWQKADNTAYDFDAPVTGNLTLTAKWNDQTINVSTQTGTGVVAQTVTYVKANPGEYTLALGADVACAPQMLDVSNVKLTIIGIGGERNITQSANGTLFIAGGYSSTGMSLTIGNNITLTGRSSANNIVVEARSGAFTMLDGSKITGNTATLANNNSAVRVNGGVFTMKGGTITGNASPDGGGVFVGGGKFVMEGGSVSGNTGNRGDVCAVYGACTMSGAAAVGVFTLDYYSGYYTPVTIAAGWTGGITKLDLAGYDTAIATIASDWLNSPVLQGSLSSVELSKIGLGEFVTLTNTRQSIGDGDVYDYYISTRGVLLMP
jgi:uncharacterized repeat protein (TIGR02543 family)